MGIIGRLFGNKKDAILNLSKFDIANTHFFSMGDVPTINNPSVNEKYSCRFIKKEGNILRFAVCVRNEFGFSYKENDLIAMSYVEFRELHIFRGKIAYVGDIAGSDRVKISAFREHISGIENCSLIAVSIHALTHPYKHQRREYFRIPAMWSVYFRAYDDGENDFIEEPDEEPAENTAGDTGINKNGNENNNQNAENKESGEDKKNIGDAGGVNAEPPPPPVPVQQMLAESGVFEVEGDYFKIRTVDISAGGFKSKVGVSVPVGTKIDCTISLNSDDLEKVIADGIVVGCEPDTRRTGFYFMRVKFLKVRSGSRNAIIKAIFELERRRTQTQRKK